MKKGFGKTPSSAANTKQEKKVKKFKNILNILFENYIVFSTAKTVQ